MSYTTKDIARILHDNPDIVVVDDYASRNLPVIRDNGDRAFLLPIVGAGLQLPKLSEFDMQTKVFAECANRALTNPDWQMVVGVPNGQYRPGQRMEPGLKKGFPDIIVTVARHSRIGLAIECKVHPNEPDEDQLWWHRRLRLDQWVVEVIYDDPQEVISTITWYLER